jgi:hypothetical protein
LFDDPEAKKYAPINMLFLKCSCDGSGSDDEKCNFRYIMNSACSKALIILSVDYDLPMPWTRKLIKETKVNLINF